MQGFALRTFTWALLLLISLPIQASDAIKVGFSVALTGRYSDPGQSQYNGIRMWANDVNSRGALLGRSVELVHYDDESNPEKSAQIYERLITTDKVDLLIGPYGSDLTLAASTVAEKHNFPMLASGAAAEKIWDRGYQNIFGVDNPAGEYMLSVVEFAKEQGLSRIALVYADTSFTREVAAGVRRQAAQHGLEIVFDEEYGASTSFTNMVGRMLPTKPDAVIGCTYEQSAHSMMREAKSHGLSPRIFAFTVAPALRSFGDILGPDAEGVMGPAVWLRSQRMPMAYDFSYRYNWKYGDHPSYQAAYGYGAGQVLEAAVRLAGELDKDKIREQLRGMTFLSLLGKYQVDETGKQVGKEPLVLQWQDGHRRLILPKRLAERPVIFPFVSWSAR